MSVPGFMPFFIPQEKYTWSSIHQSSSVVTSYPSGVNDGDLALILIMHQITETPLIPPTGSTLIASANDTRITIVYNPQTEQNESQTVYYNTDLYYKRLSASDSGASIGGNGEVKLVPMIYRLLDENNNPVSGSKISDSLYAGINVKTTTASGTGTYSSYNAPLLAGFVSLALEEGSTNISTHTFDGGTPQYTIGYSTGGADHAARVSVEIQNDSTSNISITASDTGATGTTSDNTHYAFAFGVV